MADTIFALATPPGRSGVAVVRLSGPDALSISQRLVVGALPKPRQAGLRRFQTENGEVFDQGLTYRSMVFPDVYIDQASPRDMYAQAALNAEDIEAKVLDVMGVENLSKRA